MHNNRIGIIGGMGPEATAYYYTQLVKRTHASKDQDHFHVMIDANPKIPDRTQAILNNGETPLPYLIESIERLNLLNVDKAFITCITSHYFFDQIKPHAQFELIHALDALNKALHQANIKKIGLLATSGTIKTQLFPKALKDIEVIVPNESSQADVMDAIYNPQSGIKSGHTEGIALKQLIKAGEALIAQGAQVIIGGCTEVSMVLRAEHFNVRLYDPMIVTIHSIIKGDSL
jgi:aspartate racemase